MLDFDNIEHFVKDKLEGELLTAPTGEWDKLSTQLRKRKKRSLWKYLFIDLGISLILLVGLTINNYQYIDENGHFDGLVSSDSIQELAEKPLINVDKNIDQAKSSNYTEIVDSKGQEIQTENADHGTYDPIIKQKTDVGVTSNQVDFQLSKSTKNDEEFNANKNTPLSVETHPQNKNLLESNQAQEEDPANKRTTINGIIPSQNFTEATLNLLPVEPINSNTERTLVPVNNLNGLGLRQINRRFSVDFSVGLMSHGLVLDNQTGTDLKDQLRNTHTENFGSNFNLNLNYNVSSRFEIYTGFQLEQLSSKFSSSTTETYTEMVDTTFTYWDSNQQAWLTFIGLYEVTKTKSVPFSSTNKYTLISIPFGVNYSQALGARFYLTGTLGGAIQFKGNYSGYSHTLNDSEPVQVSDIFRKKGGINAFSGVKVGYNLTERQSVYLMPWASIDINSSTSNTNDFSARFVKYGVRVGYRFNLVPR
ncbi:MAG: hypothetical protein HRT58_07280 [Crocinitomicaceae bacterium]|nr:hypothetical protein [Flavobacteriales bacterium]NQZ35451.1 hypothetical protein [Crocinitomicaceae bacterium]